MFRAAICLATALMMTGTLVTASAQTPVAAPAPSRLKMTRERLNELRIKWSQNRVKLAACKKEARSQGLFGDKRWFFLEDCMEKP